MPAPDGPGPTETLDGLLRGRLRVLQPRDGYRLSVDPLLLAHLALSAAAPPLGRFCDLGAGVGVVGLVLGPVAFLACILSPAPEGLSATAWSVAALAVWMAIWWATEAVPLFVTALLPLAALPLLGVADIAAAAAPFAHPVVFLLLGGFLIGLALEKWNLHRRIAFHIILAVGRRPLNLIAGKMLATAFLSMWITNTATTIMVLPIAMSLIAVVAPDGEKDPAQRRAVVVGDGQTVVVDVTDLLPAAERHVGVPVAPGSRIFRRVPSEPSTERTLVLVTPRIVIQEEEEEHLPIWTP